MALDLGFMYAIVAFMAMISNIIILNRTRATKYKETVEREFCVLLVFFIVFSLVDGIWGLFMSHSLWVNSTGLWIFSYGFHTMAAISAFMWAGYMVNYLELTTISGRVINIARNLILCCQILLVYSNLFTHKVFIVTEEAEYHTLGIRTVMFLIQFMYYIILMVYVSANLISGKVRSNSKLKQKYERALAFSITPLLAGIAQLAYPDGPMYSLGFMLTGTVIYSFNVTADREEYVKAEAANDAKSQFLFNMSHDIRTPMNAILGFTYMAQKHIDDKAVVEDSLDKVSSAGQHLLSLIDDILDMARIESGKLKIVLAPTDLKLETERITSIIKHAADEKSLGFVCDYKPLDSKYINCDATHVNEIMLNLLSNAVKYTKPGGSIRYTVEQTESEDPGRSSFRFTVADTGIGMSEEFIPKIFDYFTREEGSSTKGIQGTGLGMGIVKRIVDEMGGTIDIKSALGEGTTVTVDLSFEKLEEKDVLKSSETKDDFDLSGVKGKKVLLVEDNALNREIACEILGEIGLEIEEADDGLVAVNKLKEAGPKAFDLVFMDLQMPVMNGFEATKAIRALPDEAFRSLPIVAMTANAFEEDRKNALAAGMNDHMSKPIDMAELTKVLAEYLG